MAKVEEEIGSFIRDGTKPDHIPNNLSREEFDILASLSVLPDIKPSDKGRSIVIMDTIAFENEILRQLADTKTYVQLHNNPVLCIQDRIKKVITYAENEQIIDMILKNILYLNIP